MSGARIRIIIDQLPATEEWNNALNSSARQAGMDVLMDLLYVTRGAAPHLTGNLEKSIDFTSRESETSFKGNIHVSAFRDTFDYGLLRHDAPFNLGDGSIAKGGTTSPMTGASYPVGWGFAERATHNTKYFDYMEEMILEALQGAVE